VNDPEHVLDSQDSLAVGKAQEVVAWETPTPSKFAALLSAGDRQIETLINRAKPEISGFASIQEHSTQAGNRSGNSRRP
jgi:hypothetical protein